MYFTSSHFFFTKELVYPRQLSSPQVHFSIKSKGAAIFPHNLINCFYYSSHPNLIHWTKTTIFVQVKLILLTTCNLAVESLRFQCVFLSTKITLMNAALYARESTCDQQTISMQLNITEDYVGNRSWTVAQQIEWTSTR